jgi:hypothetical protein
MPEEPMVRSSPTRSGGADSISSPASSSSDEDDPGAPAMAMAAAEEQVMREERAMEIGGGATSPTTVFAVFGVPPPQPEKTDATTVKMKLTCVRRSLHSICGPNFVR